MSIAENAATATSTWNIDPAHTTVEFSVKHLMISTVRGHFGAVTGTIVLNEQDPTASSVTAEIDVTSINTRQEQRDAHLRSADFFDVDTFPSIKFQSTRIERDGDHFDVIGNLTIRDVTREVVLHTSDEGRGGDPWGGQRAGFSATTKIDRREFGLTWNQALETGGVVVGNDIKISLEVEAVKA
ncbi:YceI family protein [Longimicrobium sp.]|uniref:YceI family protein n=1 Tax=Longimicrobium sp. TaxID=2029185 RepID=UPI002E32BD2E|nr:YceI family protein [Longimicrobium sp.]HEX6039058.1 YceI family protein [Longimicrobium sp.]